MRGVVCVFLWKKDEEAKQKQMSRIGERGTFGWVESRADDGKSMRITKFERAFDAFY